MKKKLMIILAAAMLAAGCGKKEETEPEPEKTPEVTATPEPTPEETPEPEKEEEEKPDPVQTLSLIVYMDSASDSGTYDFEIVKDGAGYYLSETRRYFLECAIGEKDIESLTQLLKDCRVERFDGYTGGDDFGKTDGDYSFEITYASGKKISSSASGAAIPAEWPEVRTKLFNALKELVSAGESAETGYSADALRKEMGETDVIAAAMISEMFTGSYDDIADILFESGFGDMYPFMYDISEADFIDAGGSALICLIPKDGSVTMNISRTDESNEPVETLYSHHGNTPVLLRCETSIESFNTVVTAGTCTWYPILEGTSFLLPNGGGIHEFTVPEEAGE